MASSVVELKSREIVSEAEFLAARKKLLVKEKEFTKLRDEVSRQRLEMPWEGVKKPYTFDGPNGKESLADLFEGRSQLMIYHFMMGPGWEEGCKSCSFLADHLDGAAIHLANRDVTLVVVARAPYAEIEKFKKRMGWKFKWVSSNGSDFNFDYHVSFTKDQLAKGDVYYNYGMIKTSMEELPGLSAFARDESGGVFHTYSTYTRGLDILLGAYNFLDMAPKGRNEKGGMEWVRHHDKYDSATVQQCCSKE